MVSAARSEPERTDRAGQARRGSRAFRAATLLLCLVTLAACGGGSGHPKGIPAEFGDSAPHPWRGRVPADYDVHGVDVSRWQGEVNWAGVAGSGVDFAFIKATEGADVADPMFHTNWQRAAAAGIPRGAFHFYYFCRTAAEQAAWYIANVPYTPGALPPVLDIEWVPTSRTCRKRPDPETVRAEAATFLAILTRHYGTRPVVYTTVDFWRENQIWRLDGYEFWLRSVAGHPKDTYDGHHWNFWQYTGTGRVPGVSGEVDLNAFAGSSDSWRAWVEARQQG